MSEKKKVHMVTLMIVDHDQVSDLVRILEDARYPNHCIKPVVMGIETKVVKNWDDSHPLNNTKTMRDAFNQMFFPEPEIET